MFFKIDFRDSKANLNAGFIFRRNWAGTGWQPQYTIRPGVHNMLWTYKT
jgi:hypothetical protein